jgi:hypothetical protein
MTRSANSTVRQNLAVIVTEQKITRLTLLAARMCSALEGNADTIDIVLDSNRLASPELSGVRFVLQSAAAHMRMIAGECRNNSITS